MVKSEYLITIQEYNRQEYAQLYIVYERHARNAQMRGDHAEYEYLLDYAHFWFLAFCYGKRAAQQELPPISKRPE